MFLSLENYDSIAAILNHYPDAIHIAHVCGGWMIFTSDNDFLKWEGQL